MFINARSQEPKAFMSLVSEERLISAVLASLHFVSFSHNLIQIVNNSSKVYSR